MAQDSQVGNLQDIDANDVQGLVHEVFAKGVKPALRAVSPTRQMFQQADRGQYQLRGKKMVWSTQLKKAHGAMGTGGNLPDHAYTDPVRGEVTPARRYVRRAVDNFEEARGQGEGAFDNFIDTLYDQQWEAWKRMEIRHAIGTADGTLCKVSSRNSGTEVDVKDAYGHSGTDPLLLLEEGLVIAWIDTSDSNNVGGVAKISSLSSTNNRVTIDSNSTWEPDAATPADGDLIVAATTNDKSRDYFDTEFENATHGVWDILDPDENQTTVFGISESTNPRWAPYRESSSTFDHIEVDDHWRKAATYATEPVTPQSHTAICNPAVERELGRTLLGYQQQAQLGRTFEGGFQAVRISGQDVVDDYWFPHDVLATLCYEDLFRVDVGGGPDYYSEDGSQFSRLADYDGKEWWIREYVQCFADRRNRLAALKGITLANYSADDFSPNPY